MTKRVTFAVALCFLALSTASAQTTTTQAQGFFGLAYFSPQRVFGDSAFGKAAQARIEAEQAAKAKEIDVRTKTLDAQRAELSRQASVLSEVAQAQRVKDVDRFEVDLQRFIQDAQKELAGFQRDLENDFFLKMRPIIDQVAKEKSLRLVLNEDAGQILWADTALDITREIATRLDRIASNTP